MLAEQSPAYCARTSCHDISPAIIRMTTFSCPRSSDIVASRLQHRPRIAPRVGEQRKPSCGCLLCDCKIIGGLSGRARQPLVQSGGAMLTLHGFVYLLAEGLVLPLYDPTLNRWAETTRCFEACNWITTSHRQVGLTTRTWCAFVHVHLAGHTRRASNMISKGDKIDPTVAGLLKPCNRQVDPALYQRLS